jgi:methylthioribose-1-phosphate isomerase
MVETIQWTPEGVVMIDQTRLPLEETYVTCRDYEEVAEAIRRMVIRGAPAIGVAAAMGVALGVARADGGGLDARFAQICATLAGTRPTAVNLFWAIERMKRVYEGVRGRPLGEVRERLIAEAQLVKAEDIEINRAMGRHGAPLVPDGKTVLTHCNAGRWPPRATAPRWAWSAPRWRPASASTSSPTRRGPFCRARGSRCGNSSRTALRPP